MLFRSLSQPTWDPTTQRFWTSIPIIANNPGGCNSGQFIGPPITCDGGVLVFDPNNLSAAQCTAGFTPGVECRLGAFNPTTYTGVIALQPANLNAAFNIAFPFLGRGACNPNGITVARNSHALLLGCTPANSGFDTNTQVIDPALQGRISPTNQASNLADVANITGSDEVWFNPSIYAPSGFIGDNRYYLAASKSYTQTPACTPLLIANPAGPKFCAVLGVVSSFGTLVETIPQSSNSHSVATDAARNLIFVPQVAPASVVGAGGDTTTVGEQLCGGTSGCVVVYGSPVHQ